MELDKGKGNKMGLCSKCGAVISAGEFACNACGAKLSAVEVENALITQSKSHEMADLKRKELWTIFFSVFGLIVTAIGLAIGLVEHTGVDQGQLGLDLYKYHPYRDEALVMISGGGLLVLIAASLGFYYSIKLNRLKKDSKSDEDSSIT